MIRRKRQKAFIYSTQLEQYTYPPHFPFVAQRTVKTYNLVRELGLLVADSINVVDTRLASRTELEKFHSAYYLDILHRAARNEICIIDSLMGIGTPDCPVFRDMYTYSALACGATLIGAELLLSGKADIVFNPSGGFHHAKPEQASGFCYLNDIALGCLRLAEEERRVLYLDLDAHHGNGVQEAFYDSDQVMTISLHESGETLFPGTGFVDEIGTARGLGFNVNIPLPLGIDDKAYLYVFDRLVIPLVKAYNPDVIVVVLGMDTLAGDPLAHLSLTNNAYAEMISRLLRFDKKILATGGGGYDVEKTVRGWALAWAILCCEELNNADFSLGLGGVMLQSRDWLGGLRDRMLPVSDSKRRLLDSAVNRTVEAVLKNVFSHHGI